MTDEIEISQTDAIGRKRGGRKGVSAAPKSDVGEGVPKLDQALAGEGACQVPAQAVAPVPFDFQGKAVRTITNNGQVWFVAADVCAVLEHSNPTKAVERLDDDERALTTIQAHSGNEQTMNVITESGLYSLIFTSRKPEAKAFRRWVTGVVLPALRQTGQFDMKREARQTISPGDQTEKGNCNSITVPLPGPGRYLVVLLHDGERRVEPISFSDATSALAPLDCRSIAYTHLTAAALWEKLQHIRSVKGEPCRGVTFEKLSTTMQAGADLARQILYTYDEPMLIRRKTADMAAG